MLVTVQVNRTDLRSKEAHIMVHIFLLQASVVSALQGGEGMQHQSKTAPGNAVSDTLCTSVDAGARYFL
jgi:hypothetical protein